MRYTLLFLCLFGLSATAQTMKQNTPVTVAIGTDGYVTIAGQNYQRGYLRTYWNVTDSSLGILYSGDKTLFVRPMRDTFYLYADSSSRKARSYDELKSWFNTYFEYKN